MYRAEYAVTRCLSVLLSVKCRYSVAQSHHYANHKRRIQKLLRIRGVIVTEVLVSRDVT